MTDCSKVKFATDAALILSLFAAIFGGIFVPTIIFEVNSMWEELDGDMKQFKMISNDIWHEMMTISPNSPMLRLRRQALSKANILAIQERLRRVQEAAKNYRKEYYPKDSVTNSQNSRHQIGPNRVEFKRTSERFGGSRSGFVPDPENAVLRPNLALPVPKRHRQKIGVRPDGRVGIQTNFEPGTVLRAQGFLPESGQFGALPESQPLPASLSFVPPPSFPRDPNAGSRVPEAPSQPNQELGFGFNLAAGQIPQQGHVQGLPQVATFGDLEPQSAPAPSPELLAHLPLARQLPSIQQVPQGSFIRDVDAQNPGGGQGVQFQHQGFRGGTNPFPDSPQPPPQQPSLLPPAQPSLQAPQGFAGDGAQFSSEDAAQAHGIPFRSGADPFPTGQELGSGVLGSLPPPPPPPPAPQPLAAAGQWVDSFDDDDYENVQGFPNFEIPEQQNQFGAGQGFSQLPNQPSSSKCNCNPLNTCAPGPPGPPGLPGEEGPDGLPGVDGHHGKDSADAEPQMPPMMCFHCPPGPMGPPGPDGRSGPRGQRGTAGPGGQPGTSSVPGKPGIRGGGGARGLPGNAGQRGKPGMSAKVAIGIPGPKGERGYPGEMGDKGLDGSHGLPGTDGHLGEVGPLGARGVPGLRGHLGSLGDYGLPGIGDDANYCPCPRRARPLTPVPPLFAPEAGQALVPPLPLPAQAQPGPPLPPAGPGFKYVSFNGNVIRVETAS